MNIICFVLLIIATLIAATNFALSFIYPCIGMLLGAPRKHVSGVPALGTLLVLAALLIERTTSAWIWAATLMAIDTGGLPWFAAVMLWHGAVEKKRQ